MVDILKTLRRFDSIAIHSDLSFSGSIKEAALLFLDSSQKGTGRSP